MTAELDSHSDPPKTLRKCIRNWLLKNPKYNPFKIKYLGIQRVLTSPFRVMPDYLIIGAARCGTTTLYSYLIQHPSIYSSTEKEPGFFGPMFNTGILWYKAHFPSYLFKFYVKWIRKRDFITGEASTIYLLDPRTPKRVLKKIRDVKLIVLLRNPVDRAYSNYNFQVKRKRENRSFNQAIESELKLLNTVHSNLKEYEQNEIIMQKAYSYLLPGIYIDQLKNWFDFFAKSKFLIIKTEEFNMYPEKTLKDVFEFLGVSSYSVTNLKKQNVGSYQLMDPKTRKELIDFYKLHNRRLSDLLGIKLNWDEEFS